MEVTNFYYPLVITLLYMLLLSIFSRSRELCTNKHRSPVEKEKWIWSGWKLSPNWRWCLTIQNNDKVTKYKAVLLLFLWNCNSNKIINKLRYLLSPGRWSFRAFAILIKRDWSQINFNSSWDLSECFLLRSYLYLEFFCSSKDFSLSSTFEKELFLLMAGIFINQIVSHLLLMRFILIHHRSLFLVTFKSSSIAE